MLFTGLTATGIYNKPKTIDQNGNPVVDRKAMMFLAIVFLIELSLFVWAVVLAIRCGKRHKDLFIHIFAAFCSPILYILYYFISGCGSFDGCGVV